MKHKKHLLMRSTALALTVLLLLTTLLAGCSGTGAVPNAESGEDLTAPDSDENMTFSEPAGAATVPTEPGPVSTEPKPVSTELEEPEPVSTEPESVPTESTEAEPSETEGPAPIQPSGPVELTGLDTQTSGIIFGLAVWEDEGAVCFAHWIQETMEYSFRVVFVDLKTAAATASIDLEPCGPLSGISYLLSLDGTELLIADEGNGRLAVYDRAGAFLGWREDPAADRDALSRSNPLITDRFWKERDFAIRTEGYSPDKVTTIGFYDETDRLHEMRVNYDNLQACWQHRLLTQRYLENGSTVYELLDLDRNLLLDSTRLDRGPGENASWPNPAGAAMNADWVLVCTDAGEGYDEPNRIFLWQPDQANAVPAEIQTLTAAEGNTAP